MRVAVGDGHGYPRLCGNVLEFSRWCLWQKDFEGLRKCVSTLVGVGVCVSTPESLLGFRLRFDKVPIQHINGEPLKQHQPWKTKLVLLATGRGYPHRAPLT